MKTFKRTACLCLMLLLLFSFPAALIVSAEELDTGQTASAQAEINTLDESIICQAASITQEENGGISLWLLAERRKREEKPCIFLDFRVQ